jgi:LEA14-like dessication related protein
MKKLILLSSLVLVVLTGCRKIQDPQFRRLEEFGVKSFGIEKIDLGFKVTYFNPNNFGINVKEAGADFYIDSVYMGKFTQDLDVEVGKNSEFSIPFSGSVPLSTALKLKLNDLANRELFVQANGSVKVGKAGVYITKPFTYSGKHKVDFKL